MQELFLREEKVSIIEVCPFQGYPCVYSYTHFGIIPPPRLISELFMVT